MARTNPVSISGNNSTVPDDAVYYYDMKAGEYRIRVFTSPPSSPAKKLVIDDQILFPLSTFNRSFRYTRYGFGLCGESKEKLVQSLQGAVLTNQNDFYFGLD